MKTDDDAPAAMAPPPEPTRLIRHSCPLPRPHVDGRCGHPMAAQTMRGMLDAYSDHIRHAHAAALP